MPFRDTKIALTGFMGVGKSSVARHLAHVMKCRWIDLDRIIEENAGRSVAEIIDSEGIEFYRTVESQNLERVLNDTDSHILSLGGGTWTVPATLLNRVALGQRPGLFVHARRFDKIEPGVWITGRIRVNATPPKNKAARKR